MTDFHESTRILAEKKETHYACAEHPCWICIQALPAEEKAKLCRHWSYKSKCRICSVGG